MPGRRAGREQADDQAAARREPAVGHHCAEHQRRQARAAAEDQSPQDEQLPELRDLRRQDHGGGDEGGRRHHDPAQPIAADEDRRERAEQAEQGEANREHRRELVGGPAELLAERLQHRAGQAERRRGGEHREEGDRGDHPRIVDSAAAEQAGKSLGEHGFLCSCKDCSYN